MNSSKSKSDGHLAKLFYQFMNKKIKKYKVTLEFLLARKQYKEMNKL